MKKILYYLILIVPVFILIFCTASTTNPPLKITKINAPKGIAVVELFTSQGCSSCPPADRLLGTYAQMDNVFALSFHVDYWDKLGWKDPFSNAGYTERQKMYATKLNADVYTPQAVINGGTEIIGSDENNLMASINKSITVAATAQISINDIKTEDAGVSFNCILEGNIAGNFLHVALVQDKITTSIRAGENEGVNLTNFNVVREFKTTDIKDPKTNSVFFKLPPGYHKNDLSIIAFVQLRKNLKIVGATKVSL